MISLAVIPILLSVSPAPQFEIMEKVSIIQLYRVSPLGVFGTVFSGMAIGAIYAMGPVFAVYLSTGEDIPFFIVTCVGGGVPLYALCGVHINDYLNPTQMVAASGTIVLLSSLGATIYFHEVASMTRLIFLKTISPPLTTGKK